jgi:hypothetical protein
MSIYGHFLLVLAIDCPNLLGQFDDLIVHTIRLGSAGKRVIFLTLGMTRGLSFRDQVVGPWISKRPLDFDNGRGPIGHRIDVGLALEALPPITKLES